MNNTNEPVGSAAGLSTLQRARFGPGMLLQHEDLEQLNTYTRELSRLLFQSFFGCGVVCGLQVSGAADCGPLKVTVQKGLALACSGDPVYVPEEKIAQTDQDKFDPNNGTEVWVALCPTKKCCAPRTTTCCSDDDEATSDCTREKDGFEIRIYQERPDCACGCPQAKDTVQSGAAPNQGSENFCKCVDPKDPCYEDHYAGKCGCTCGECSGCDCKCILLARLYKTSDTKTPWKADHSVRRFIRPGLIVDPQIEKDKEPQATNAAGQEQSKALPMIQKRIADIKEAKRLLQEEEKQLKQEQKLQLQQQPVVAATGEGKPK
ncbi:MAG TPA: hypothetical protein DC054_10730 [Blastocatellia bacterium]|nr:hypothetical protein [Blastocatellia bacterium]